MELNFTGIIKAEGIKEEYNITEYPKDSTIIFCGEKLSIVSPVTVKGSAINYEGKINVEISISAKVERTCSRCLEVFREDVQVYSAYVFVKEITDNEGDYYTYKSEMVDITDLVIGDISAGLSMKPLCSEDCKGICPICGVNKNIIDCKCKSEEIDPRMQALSKLFDRK